MAANPGYRDNAVHTSNSIKSVFATVRHRSIRTTGAASQYSARLMLFTLVMGAAKPGND
jgi:hypothetical protein